jgi:hypothetical protein
VNPEWELPRGHNPLNEREEEDKEEQKEKNEKDTRKKT